MFTYDPINIRMAMLEEGVATAGELAQLAGLNINTARAVLRGDDVKTSTLGSVAKALNRNTAAFYLPRANSKLVTQEAG